MGRQRLDHYLVLQGFVKTRERGLALILGGKVRLNGVPAKKGGESVKKGDRVEIIQPDHPYVGRGGLKLAAALKYFSLNVSDYICLDGGASTGGFTDCLLQHGASKVYAVDVGYGQLAWKLSQDNRVVILDRTNLRYIDPTKIKEPIDLVTLDLSFISLTKIFPTINSLLKQKKQASLIALIKPQFEVGREKIAKGGIVKEEAARKEAVEIVRCFAKSLGWIFLGLTQSPIQGAQGNVEYLAMFQIRGGP